MFKDFRGYLEYLEEKGKLVKVKKEVDVRFEIAAGIRKISDTDGPALIFENIKGYPDWRVAGGTYATQKLIALALGLPLEADDTQIIHHYLEYAEKRIKPKLVPTGPVKEIIIKGGDIDLSKLPVCTYSEEDAGPYLTSGVEIAKHPDTGVQNVSIHRRKILDKNRTGLLAGLPGHLYLMAAAAERKTQGLEVATVLGVVPSLVIASQIKAPKGVDECEIAGALQGEPLEVVKCETIDVEVPANAEVVIEGVTIPGERVECGPFGEFPGNYITLGGAPKTSALVVRVTGITMRKAPIFQALLTGMPMTENHCVKKWALSARAYRVASQIADVKAVNITTDSAGLRCVVSICKRDEIEPRTLTYSLFSAPIEARQVVVVDDDIDVFAPREVEWAVATRILPHKDVLIIPPVNRGFGGPSIPEEMSAKWGIDATMPLKDRVWYKKACMPGVDDIDYV